MKNIEDRTRSNAEVRYELYGVLNEMRKMQNHHIIAWGDKHESPCRCCADYEQKRRGVLWAIRNFGGRPRPGWA